MLQCYRKVLYKKLYAQAAAAGKGRDRKNRAGPAAPISGRKHKNNG